MYKLEKYFIKKFLSNFFIIFSIISSVLWFLNFKKISGAIIFKALPFYKIVILSFLLMPFFLFYLMPFFGLILSFSSIYQFVKSNELIVLRSNGVGEKFFNFIILKIAFFLTFISFFFFFLFPIFAENFYNFKFSLQNERIFQLLSQNKINYFNGNILYFRKFDENSNLYDLKIIKHNLEKITILKGKRGTIKNINKNLVIEIEDLNLKKFDFEKKDYSINLFSKFAEININDFLQTREKDQQNSILINFLSFKKLLKHSEDALYKKEINKRIISLVQVFIFFFLSSIILIKQNSERISKSKYYFIAIFANIAIYLFSVLLQNITLSLICGIVFNVLFLIFELFFLKKVFKI